jgi:hypothetical protein
VSYIQRGDNSEGEISKFSAVLYIKNMNVLTYSSGFKFYLEYGESGNRDHTTGTFVTFMRTGLILDKENYQHIIM